MKKSKSYIYIFFFFFHHRYLIASFVSLKLFSNVTIHSYSSIGIPYSDIKKELVLLLIFFNTCLHFTYLIETDKTIFKKKNVDIYLVIRHQYIQIRFKSINNKS